MIGSCSNPGEEYQYQYQYPYPSYVCAPNFVTVKLTGKDKYGLWKTQMLCLLKSHDMFGFIDGTLKNPTQNSVSGKEKMGDYMLWERSDALVKGWILGSLSEQVLGFVINLLNANADFSAKDVWDKLQTIYSPPDSLLQLPEDLDDKEEEILSAVQGDITSEDANLHEEAKKEDGKKKQEAYERAKVHQRLYEAILSQKIQNVTCILRDGKVEVTDKITINGNTALHIVMSTTKESEFLQKMLEMVPHNTILDVLNSDGSTLLHVAAIVGNTEAAKMLVEKNQDLLCAKDKEGHTPLARALSNMHTDTYLYLLNTTKSHDREMGTFFAGTSGDELLVNAISSKDYHSAWELILHYHDLNRESALMAIAQNFPRKLNIWERKIHSTVTEPDGVLNVISVILVIGGIISLYIKTKRKIILLMFLPTFFMAAGGLTVSVFKGIYKLLQHIIRMLSNYAPLQQTINISQRKLKFYKEVHQIHYEATEILTTICGVIKNSKDSRPHHYYYTKPVLEATRQNAYEVVELIVSFFPNAIWSTDEHGHNIIQCSVINRSEKVYNLLYQMSEHKNIYRTIKDPFGNNLLHLAARLAPTNKLNPISGAALQLQRELQWFKEVEGFVCPLNIKQSNSFGETPQMVFTREHKELVIEGEKWMKATAESYTITAALITTIVFAAAITVPGGNNQDGIPIFSNKAAFSIFAIFDAISLFTSTTSLLMFLSILTTRFAEQDFLFSLPTKLIVGLTTLFISTTAMIVAFGATLFLVFGQRESWILIPIAALTCLPITSFVTLQFPLIADLASSTYGRSIFGKKRDHPFY